MTMKSIATKTMIVLVMITAAACGSGVTATAPMKVSFSAAKNILASLSKVQLVVSGSDMTTIMNTQSSPFSSTITFSEDVSVGSSRNFTATAAIQGVTTEGYQGASTADVTVSGGSVPITMLYVNFSADPATTSSGPQISSLSALYNNGNVSVFVDFTAAVNLNTLSGVVEFIPTAATSFRNQSIINQLKGSVDVTMPSPGSAYIMFNGNGTGLSAILYNQNDASQSAAVDAVLSGNNTIELSMSQADFKSVVDSGVNGQFNVLAGTLSNPSVPLTPSDTSGFTASSAAVSTSGGNVIIYNAAFDTTSLQ